MKALLSARLKNALVQDTFAVCRGLSRSKTCEAAWQAKAHDDIKPKDSASIKKGRRPLETPTYSLMSCLGRSAMGFS